MTIERLIFNPPLHAENISSLNLDESLLFAKRKEVPPGYKIDLTPAQSPITLVLRTMSVKIRGEEETIGEIEMTNPKNNRSLKHPVDEESPAIAIAGVDIRGGITVTEVIRYISHHKQKRDMDTKTAAQMPLKLVVREEVTSTPVPVEQPIPEEIPHIG
jgi:hypothetical protein